MGKRKIFVLVVLGFLILLLAGEVFLLLNKNKKQNISSETDQNPDKELIGDIKTPLGPPEELSTKFDPTKNTPMFVIESADATLGTLKLKFVFPHTWEGRRVTSRIICKDGDIKIVSPTNSIGENVTIDTLINKIQETSSELMIFSGRCTDNTCAEINKDCQLYAAKN